jgi:hypothetical protein
MHFDYWFYQKLWFDTRLFPSDLGLRKAFIQQLLSTAYILHLQVLYDKCPLSRKKAYEIYLVLKSLPMKQK